MNFSKLDIAAWYIAKHESLGKAITGDYPYHDVAGDFFSVKGRAGSIWHGVRPINDPDIKQCLGGLNVSSILDDKHMLTKTIEQFDHWLPCDLSNHTIEYVDGTTEAFESLYLRNNQKTFYLHNNEYWYHYHRLDQLGAVVKNYTPAAHDGVLILSYPFYYLGEDLTQCLYNAKQQGLYTVLDLTMWPMSNLPNVEKLITLADETVFSFGKMWPIAHARCGFRITKKPINDGVNLKNRIPLINRIGAGVVCNLMQKYSIEYTRKKFFYQADIINKYFLLEPTSVLTISKGDFANQHNHTFSRYNINNGDRLCITSLIENFDLITSDHFKEIVNDHT